VELIVFLHLKFSQHFMPFYVKKFIAISGLSISILSAQYSFAQKFSSAEKKDFRKREDSLKNFADNIVFAQEADERFHADSSFIRMLVRTLKMKNSFNYPFDSLQTISRLYSPDSAFRTSACMRSIALSLGRSSERSTAREETKRCRMIVFATTA